MFQLNNIALKFINKIINSIDFFQFKRIRTIIQFTRIIHEKFLNQIIKPKQKSKYKNFIKLLIKTIKIWLKIIEKQKSKIFVLQNIVSRLKKIIEIVKTKNNNQKIEFKNKIMNLESENSRLESEIKKLNCIISKKNYSSIKPLMCEGVFE